MRIRGERTRQADALSEKTDSTTKAFETKTSLRTQWAGTGLEQSATIIRLAQTPEQTGLTRLQYTR
jgi:hypothetical protein